MTEKMQFGVMQRGVFAWNDDMSARFEELMGASPSAGKTRLLTASLRVHISPLIRIESQCRSLISAG